MNIITRLSLPLFTLVLLGVCGFTHAQIYKWVDAEGRTHYSDKKPQNTAVEDVKVEVNTYTSVSYAPLSESHGDTLIMYTTSWCGYCKKARRYFKRNGIPFNEFDIERDRGAKRDYEALGGRGVPVILLGKERMNGFSEDGFKRFYQRAAL